MSGQPCGAGTPPGLALCRPPAQPSLLHKLSLAFTFFVLKATKSALYSENWAQNHPSYNPNSAKMATFATSSHQPFQADIDMSFLNELYEEIEHNPPAIEARKILIQQYMEVGWFDAAGGQIQELLNIDPYNTEAMLWSEVISEQDRMAPKTPPPKTVPIPKPKPVQLNQDLDQAKLDLQMGYEALRAQAEKLLRETRLIRDLALKNDTSSPVSPKGKEKATSWSWFSVPAEKKESAFAARFESHIVNLTALSDGRVSSVIRVRQPGSARAVAREMESSPQKAVDIAVSDLDGMARWLRSTNPSTSSDELREILVKRVQALSTALPENMRMHATTALMHAEHEVLQRRYRCNNQNIEETMLGDPIAEIPRNRFWVTEDGYPWDMEELAQAIESKGGVMRNPLSFQMFTTNDIRAIIQHPLGKRLAALEMEQKNLSQGFRQKTIDEIDKMATVLLADNSEDQMESRHVVDAFLAYIATLPASEQRALDELRVPAKDSHTGQGYDTTIGESVRDAQGNRVCVHKTGDFLKQAASHLRKKR